MLTLRRRNRRATVPTTLVINQERCLSCGACVAVCPPDALFVNNIHLTVDQETCTSCERCVVMCPVHALSLVPEETVPA